MTRKDYIVLAGALRNAVSRHTPSFDSYQGAMDAAYQVAVVLAEDNPRFDREHFLSVVTGIKELNSRPSHVHDTAKNRPRLVQTEGWQSDGQLSR
jgi:hypothetical protein